jgi:hypothetical protein
MFSLIGFRVAFVRSSISSGSVSQHDLGLCDPSAGPGLVCRYTNLTLIECQLTLVGDAFAPISGHVGRGMTDLLSAGSCTRQRFIRVHVPSPIDETELYALQRAPFDGTCSLEREARLSSTRLRAVRQTATAGVEAFDSVSRPLRWRSIGS